MPDTLHAPLYYGSMCLDLQRPKGGRVPCRLTSIYPRIWFTAGSVLGCLAILNVIFSDPGGTQPANAALMSVLLAWCAVFAVRGWRCATLLASCEKVTVRGLVRTRSWPWQQIDRFVAGTRPTRWMWLPIRVRRRVLGVRLCDGQTHWVHEINCRTAGDASTWIDDSVAKLNELLTVYSARPARAVDEP
jgi:hypothetical protein